MILLSDERSVSTVIAVVLMIAIVVIISTTVAVYTTDIANSVDNPAPRGAFSFSEATCGGVKVTYTGGESIRGERLYFTGAATEYTQPGSITEWTGDEISAGDSVTIGVEAGETLRVNWQDREGDSGAVLSEYDVPDNIEPKGSASISNLDAATAGNDWIAASVSFSGVNNVFVVTNTDGNGGEATTTLDSPGDYSFSYDGAKKSGTTKIDVSGQTGANVETPYSVTIYKSSERNCKLSSASS
ncbi:type IV pilin [Halobellus sp. EA9]|uniref:type IV pilin n=1 Tax=Halobellus sp. EA9 TaxID=3421647 RepID=UPI003EBF9F6D